MADAPEISVVIPAYNEEDSVLPLARSLLRVLRRMRRTFEVIFVDDGSTDATPVRFEEILRWDPRIRVIGLVHNAGQTAALCAGIDHARGRYLMALDADQQNDPADIPRIVRLLDEGYDVVSGWRRFRKDSITRRIPSIAANTILSWVTGVRLHDFGCTLKGYRSEFIRRVPLYSDMHRYLPAFAKSVGARVVELEVAHHPRRSGTSKYGMGRIYRVFSDILVLQVLVHFAFRPLHWFGRVSILVFLLVAVFLLSSLASEQDGSDPLEVAQRTMVFPTITVLGLYLGTTLLSLGFLCELINRVESTEIKQLFTVVEPEVTVP